MSYSFSYSESSTFTITHARHMAAKVATDLKRMQRFYGQPSDIEIADFETEVIEMLKAGYVDTVTYGFKRDGRWIEPTLRYTARELAGATANDDDPGRVRANADISGASFASYMTYTTAWHRISAAERETFNAKLPFVRTGAAEPSISGYLSNDRVYSSGAEPSSAPASGALDEPPTRTRRSLRATYHHPDIDPQARLAGLVGLDEHKDRLAKILGLLVNPAGLSQWASRHHPGAEPLLHAVLRRPPLVILAGDVGSGKTELAETIGDAVARQEQIDITLFPLSLSTRGQGRVGEMTQLLSAAFDHTVEAATKLKSMSGKARGAVLLLVDEADALAQSREAAQMHHEDRAGVNAFIRGIDRIANGKLPAAVLMCTNRLDALDPAVRRRAADVLRFSRPDDEQRRFVLSKRLAAVGIGKHDIEALVSATGRKGGISEYGFTFSDLTQRLLPAIVLDAYPSKAISGFRAVEIARSMTPTPPFRDGPGERS